MQGKAEALRLLLNGCEAALLAVRRLTDSCASLGTKEKRTRDRLKFGSADLASLRLKVSIHTGALNIFIANLNSTALAHLIRILEDSVDEALLDTGRDTVLSLASDTSDITELDAHWDRYRMEMMADGLSSEFLADKRDLAIAVVANRLNASASLADSEDQSGNGTEHALVDDDAAIGASTGPEEHRGASSLTPSNIHCSGTQPLATARKSALARSKERSDPVKNNCHGQQTRPHPLRNVNERLHIDSGRTQTRSTRFSSPTTMVRLPDGSNVEVPTEGLAFCQRLDRWRTSSQPESAPSSKSTSQIVTSEQNSGFRHALSRPTRFCRSLLAIPGWIRESRELDREFDTARSTHRGYDRCAQHYVKHLERLADVYDGLGFNSSVIRLQCHKLRSIVKLNERFSDWNSFPQSKRSRL